MTIDDRMAELEARVTKLESSTTKPATAATLCRGKTRTGKLCRSRALHGGKLCALHASEESSPAHKAETQLAMARDLSRLLKRVQP